jgi:hypothetical protein
VGLKKYIGFSLLLIIAVGGYIYSIESGVYTVTILEYSLELPIAVWVLVPILVLFIFTIIHLMFYGTVNYCKGRGFVKDESSIVETLKAILLQKNDKRKFKTRGYKHVSSILNQFNIDVKDNAFTSSNEGLNQIVSQIKDIKAGKYVNDKSLKLGVGSVLAKQNLINKINEQVDYAVDVLKKSDQFSSDVIRIAYFKVLNEKSMTTVKKLYPNVILDKEMALRLFVKDIDNNEFGLTKENILKITKNLNYSQEEYITLAKLYKDALSPDKVLELFETISEENDVAVVSYLYILVELEMIDKTREVLTGYNENEMLVFRALLDLKEAGKHYSMDDLTYN